MTENANTLDVNAAIKLHLAGQTEEAERQYRNLIRHNTDIAAVYANLASICGLSGRSGEAADLLQKAIQIKPHSSDAHQKLAIILREQGKLSAAIASFERALDLDPDNCHTHNLLGLALRDRGNIAGAIACFRRAIQIDPDSHYAYSNLSLSLLDKAQLDEAVACCQKALQLKPDSHQAHTNLGLALRDRGQFAEAVASFERAIELQPDYRPAHSNLIYTLSFGQLVSPQEILRITRRFESATCPRPTATNVSHGKIASGRKMRVAFISGEIGDHAVSYFLESYLRHYTRSNVELTLYSTLWRPDGTKNELIELVDRQRDLFGLGDNDARAQIIADGIDILIDTTSHMAGNRLGMLSQRCAPIQCHYIGFHGTTGIGAIDYFIGDDEITPPEFASHFSETIVRLPRLWVAYTPRSDLPETEQNSSADEICFGCFNNLMKVREETLDIWGEVLLSVPNAKLILKDRRCADAYTRERIVGFLETRGITKERIEFIGQVSSWREHMRLYNRIDIALDTSPLNSGTTGFDALIMGTPLVALRGNWMGGRMSSSMLKSLGRPEWIASDRQDFTKIILKLVSDRQQLKRRKSALRSEVLNSQLCDGKSLAAALEQAFTRMIGDFNAQALPIGS